jgi:hypothetical protein
MYLMHAHISARQQRCWPTGTCRRNIRSAFFCLVLYACLVIGFCTKHDESYYLYHSSWLFAQCQMDTEREQSRHYIVRSVGDVLSDNIGITQEV